jgi:hypothetical protein
VDYNRSARSSESTPYRPHLNLATGVNFFCRVPLSLYIRNHVFALCLHAERVLKSFFPSFCIHVLNNPRTSEEICPNFDIWRILQTTVGTLQHSLRPYSFNEHFTRRPTSVFRGHQHNIPAPRKHSRFHASDTQRKIGNKTNLSNHV